jgi:hypothetical protein
MAHAPGGHRDQPDEPRPPRDDDHPGQLSGIGLPSGIEGAQTCGEGVRIPSPVRVMRLDELPAAAPDFAGLGFVHLQAGGRLCPSAESASSSGIRFRLATRTSVGKASAEAGRRSRVRPLIQKSQEARRVSGPPFRNRGMPGWHRAGAIGCPAASARAARLRVDSPGTLNSRLRMGRRE